MHEPLARRLLRALLPKQSWLDRAVRGRAWIPTLGVLLLAVVGMRVEVLKLTSSTGTQLQLAAQLESQNAALRSSVSELSGNQRITRLAEQMGMVMPGPMDVHFVPSQNGTHVGAAIRAIHAPAPTKFLQSLAAERQLDGASARTAANTSAVGDLAGGYVTATGGGSAAGSGTTGSSGGTTGAASTAGTGATAGTGSTTVTGSTAGAGSTAGTGATAGTGSGSGTTTATGASGSTAGTQATGYAQAGGAQTGTGTQSGAGAGTAGSSLGGTTAANRTTGFTTGTAGTSGAPASANGAATLAG